MTFDILQQHNNLISNDASCLAPTHKLYEERIISVVCSISSQGFQRFKKISSITHVEVQNDRRIHHVRFSAYSMATNWSIMAAKAQMEQVNLEEFNLKDMKSTEIWSTTVCTDTIIHKAAYFSCKTMFLSCL